MAALRKQAGLLHSGHPLKYARHLRIRAKNDNTSPASLPTLRMSVLALTILISSCLAGIFIACFAFEIRRARRSSPERDSLLPLDLDQTTVSSPEPNTPLQPQRP